MNTTTATLTSTGTTSSSELGSVRAIALAVFLLGAGLVFTVGLAHSTTLHNAAHDSRHALAFPCH